MANKFWIFDASSWLFYTKLVTMHDHLNIKNIKCQYSCIPGLLKHQQTNEVTLDVLRFPRLLLLITICLSDPFEQFCKFQDGGNKFFRDIENKQSKTQAVKGKEKTTIYMLLITRHVDTQLNA
jgi:hypothetical protein